MTEAVYFMRQVNEFIVDGGKAVPPKYEDLDHVQEDDQRALA